MVNTGPGGTPISRSTVSVSAGVTADVASGVDDVSGTNARRGSD
jgi:hypothetical protein